MIEIPLIAGQLPVGYCFSNWQQTLSDFMSLSKGQFPGTATIWNFGSSSAGLNLDLPWWRNNVDGTPDRVYVHASVGAFAGWISPYPSEASSFERRIWTGTTVQLETFDGGSAGVVTPTSGPFWEVDPNFAAIFPVGVGTLPSTTAIPLAGTGGEETHLLAAGESGVGIHTHGEQSADSAFDSIGGSGANRRTFGAVSATVIDAQIPTLPAVEAAARLAHNNMPPYRGVYFIKRTIRVFYTA